jgi:hypothetical protein
MTLSVPRLASIIPRPLELLGGIAVLFPRTAFYGATTIIAVMLGVLGHHAYRGEWVRAGGPLLLGTGLAIIAYARRPEFIRKPPSPGQK